MPDPTSVIAGRYGNLKERQFQFTQERADVVDELNEQKEARAQALAEKTLAIEGTRLQHDTQQDLDTANFLKHFQTVQHTDPKYEDKIAMLAANYPLAGGDKNVQTVLGIRNTARNTYIEAAKSGGAYDFPEGPARDAFHKTFNETGDFNQARAAGKTTAESDKAVRDAVAQGYLTQEDFAHPEGAALPPIYNRDGSINYQKAQDLAAQRAGQTTGKVTAAENKDIAVAQAFVTSYLKDREKTIDEEPNAAELYKIYSSKLLAHERGKAGPAPAPNEPATASGEPAPTLSATPKNVTTAEDYAALQPGETFLSNGRLGRKPAK